MPAFDVELAPKDSAYAGEGHASGVGNNGKSLPKLRREDLQLVCFDVL
jgi:hypothetical protein